MRRENRKNVIWNIGTLFIQEFFILISLFTIIRNHNRNIELFFFFQFYTCLEVYVFTGLVLWITGCYKYAKGLGGILLKKELKSVKAGQNVLFFLKITALISIVINLIISSVYVINAGDSLSRAGVDFIPYLFPLFISNIPGSTYYGLLLLIILLPIYIRVKMVMDQAEESNLQ